MLLPPSRFLETGRTALRHDSIADMEAPQFRAENDKMSGMKVNLGTCTACGRGTHRRVTALANSHSSLTPAHGQLRRAA